MAAARTRAPAAVVHRGGRGTGIHWRGGGAAACRPGANSPHPPRQRRQERTATPGIWRPAPWVVAASRGSKVVLSWAGTALHPWALVSPPALRTRVRRQRDRVRVLAAVPPPGSRSWVYGASPWSTGVRAEGGAAGGRSPGGGQQVRRWGSPAVALRRRPPRAWANACR